MRRTSEFDLYHHDVHDDHDDNHDDHDEYDDRYDHLDQAQCFCQAINSIFPI